MTLAEYIDDPVPDDVRELADGWAVAGPCEQPRLPLNLPDEFWAARESLSQIREFAHCRGIGADAVLAAVLARVAAATPPSVTVTPNAKGAIPLNLAVALLGPSGSGKSEAVGAASAAIRSPLIEIDNGVPSSGEGLVEAYMGLRDERDIDDEGKSHLRKVRGQVRRSALFYADEGEEFLARAHREGASLLTTLRSMVSGADVGSHNATAERTRHLGRHSYRFALVAGFQPGKVDAILADSDGGTPQRFLWVKVTDPTIPTDPVPVVESLGWRPRPDNLADLQGDGTTPRGSLRFPADIGQRIHREAIERARGELVLDEGDSHSAVMTVKVSALLCLLENRVEITREDWELAETVVDVSRNVRIHAEHDRRRRFDDNRRRSAELEGERQAVTSQSVQAIERDRLERAAGVIGRRAHRDPNARLVVRHFADSLPSASRDLIRGERPAIAFAIDEGWLEPDEGGWKAGPITPPEATP